MMSPIPLFHILLIALCVIPSKAFWERQSHQADGVKRSIGDGSGTYHNSAGWKAKDSTSSSSPTPSFTQGMSVTTAVPIYEVCSAIVSNSSSCSTVLETRTTKSCSTVLTAWFQSVTVTDCQQNITFSTQSSYSLTSTAIILPTGTSPSPSYSTYVESIVSYYIAPWQSLAAKEPSGITVRICKTELGGQISCTEIQEVWVVHTNYVSVYVTSTYAITSSFSLPVVIRFGPNQNITAGSGNFTLSTQIIYTRHSLNSTTSISVLGTPLSSPPPVPNRMFAAAMSISPKLSTSTTTVIGSGTTITKTLKQVWSSEPTTTFTSTTRITKTTTVHPPNVTSYL